MKRTIAKRLGAILALAIACSLFAVAGTAFAYYTDTSRATGTLSFAYEPDEPHTDIEETPDKLGKVIRVQNTANVREGVPALVRVKVIYPNIEGVNVTITAEDGWAIQEGNEPTSTDGDNAGWLYFTSPVDPQEFTSQIKVDVDIPNADVVKQDFDIIVLQQCTSVSSNSDGSSVAGNFAGLMVSMDSLKAFDRYEHITVASGEGE